MIKRIFLLIFLIPVLLLSGCNVGFKIKAWQVVSEYRKCLFVANCEDFSATFTSGKRESSYSYDGVSSNLVEFGVLTVQFFSKLEPNNIPQYVLFIDTIQYEDILEFNPIDGTYVADIGKDISNKSDIYLRVYGGGINDQTKMKCVSNNWKVSYKQAFNTALQKFKPTLKKQIKHNSINGEFFIKIVGDKSDQTLNICWYVSYLGVDKTTLACIIDVYSGQIIAFKKAN